MEKSRIISYILFGSGVVLLLMALYIESPVWSDLLVAISVGALLFTLKSASRVS